MALTSSIPFLAAHPLSAAIVAGVSTDAVGFGGLTAMQKGLLLALERRRPAPAP